MCCFRLSLCSIVCFTCFSSGYGMFVAWKMTGGTGRVVDLNEKVFIRCDPIGIALVRVLHNSNWTKGSSLALYNLSCMCFTNFTQSHLDIVAVALCCYLLNWLAFASFFSRKLCSCMVVFCCVHVCTCCHFDLNDRTPFEWTDKYCPTPHGA